MQLKTNMSTDIKLSKAQISKIIQSRRFLSKHLGPLLKTGLTLIARVSVPLELPAAASAADAGIRKRYLVLKQQL